MKSSRNGKFKLPVWIIILDSIGSVFLGLGVAAHFADVNIIPAALQTEGYGVKMMILGGILYMPALAIILNKLINRGPREI
jgi:hypothetical protein